MGRAAELRGRPALRARDEPVDRAHAARHRDVGADGQGARLPEAQDRLRRHPQARALQPGLGRLRPPGVRPVQARPHEPRLLDLRAVGRRRGVLLGDRQEGGPADGRHQARPRAGQGHRALDRALRRHDAVHLRRAAQARPRLRVGGRDGGGDARRLQPAPRQPRQAHRDLSLGGHVLLRQPVHHARRAVGDRRPARRRGQLPEVPRGEHRRRDGGALRLPSRRPRRQARRPAERRQRRRPQAARRASSACRSRACSPR